MKPLAILGVLALCLVTSCGGRKEGVRIVQDGEGVLVDAPEFSLRIPGAWEEREPPADFVVFSGGQENREVIVSRFFFASPLDKEGQIEAGQEIIDLFIEIAEEDMDKGKVIPAPAHIDEDDGTVWGGFYSVEASGMVVFSRLFCRSEVAVNVYYGAWGSEEAPRAADLAEEFSGILHGLEFKREP